MHSRELSGLRCGQNKAIGRNTEAEFVYREGYFDRLFNGEASLVP